jgi:Oxidoreductase molybdopterin binding domain
MRLLTRRLPEPPTLLRQGPLREKTFTSRLHDPRVASLLGLWLGVAFGVCFATGLFSHFMQHPPPWLDWPSRPVNLYRVTQGLHVTTGLACVPLLLAKLWTVYPLLWEWPPIRSIAHAAERLSIIPLIAGSVFQLATGIANIAQWYQFRFFFTVTHYWVAWITIGALLIHIAAKLAIVRANVGAGRRYADATESTGSDPAVAEPTGPEPTGPEPTEPEPTEPGPAEPGPAEPEPAEAESATPPPTKPDAVQPSGGLSRRGLGVAVGTAAGVITLVTAGQWVPGLGAVDLLAPRRPDIGPEHLPINRTARAARVLTTARDPGYQLQIVGPRRVTLTLDELRAFNSHSVHLPITCVEGWSAQASWHGPRLRDLLDAAAIPSDATVRVESLEARGGYRTSEVTPSHARDPLTLLATELNGDVLSIDHGYPARLIAPNRPGVLQTKWVHRVVML